MDIAPIVVTVAHSLGKAEATRRIKARIEDARAHQSAKLKIAEENWDGGRLSFRVALLGQPVTGSIDVGDDNARIEVKLSWYLGHMVKPAEGLIRQEGEKILAAA